MYKQTVSSNVDSYKLGHADQYPKGTEIVENTDVYTFVHGGSCYDDGVLTLSSAATAIRAKTDESEWTDGLCAKR